jgi:hypothetical protein
MTRPRSAIRSTRRFSSSPHCSCHAIRSFSSLFGRSTRNLARGWRGEHLLGIGDPGVQLAPGDQVLGLLDDPADIAVSGQLGQRPLVRLALGGQRRRVSFPREPRLQRVGEARAAQAVMTISVTKLSRARGIDPGPTAAEVSADGLRQAYFGRLAPAETPTRGLPQPSWPQVATPLSR